MKIGLFFGSFNPIHNGHLMLANYLVEYTDINQIWLIVSPHNPLKSKSNLLDAYQRYEMVYRAIGDSDLLRASNIEFSMPKPSYTIDTLAYVSDKYPKKKFVLIIGTDNLHSFHKWKNYQSILDFYEIYVYPRGKLNTDKWKKYPNMKFIVAPQVDISSSFIRKSVKAQKDVRYFMPLEAYEYLKEMHFYEK